MFINNDDMTYNTIEIYKDGNFCPGWINNNFVMRGKKA